jgi:DNA polymerase-3 subunit beta
MLLSISKEKLLKPILLTSGFIEKKQTMPILLNVYIKKNGNTLTIVANDFEIQACIVITDDEMLGSDFIITLPSKKLQDILRVIPENAKVVFEQQGNKILVKSGKLRYTLQSMPADNYPLIKLLENPICEFTLDQVKLKQMIGQIQYAMADKDSRVFLNGMYLEVNGNNLQLVATDAHRLALINTELISEIQKNGVIIPRKSVLELYKLLEDNLEDVVVKIYQNQICFEIEGKQLITKIIDGKYPDYNRVIPVTNDKLCLINRFELLKAVDRVSVIGSEKVKHLSLELSNCGLSISYRNEEQEESIDEIDVVYNHDIPINICFNLNYIRDMISNIQSDFLQLAFFDNSRSVLITIPEESYFKAVVMPLRA